MKFRSANLYWCFLLLLISSFSQRVDGQSENILRNYYLNQVLINPASSGSEFYSIVNLSFSKQWLGFDHSPSLQMLSTSLRMGNYDFYNPKQFLNKSKFSSNERIGFGAVVYNANEGPYSARGGKLAYAYHVPFDESRLSLGLSISFRQLIFDQSVFNPVVINDPIIDYSRESVFNLNSDIGVLYYKPEFYVGLSALNLLPANRKTYWQEVSEQEFWFQGGYIFDNLADFKIEPSIFVGIKENTPLFYDLRTKFYYKSVNWISFTYRSYKAVKAGFGIKVRPLYIIYSAEFNLSRIASYNMGTHQVGIGMNIGLRRTEGF